MKTSSICIACCLWAAASCSTSAGAESAAGRALELELELARRPRIYLVLDTAGRRLAVKARGVELATVPLDDAVVARYRRRGGRSAPPAAALPIALEVRASDSHRPRVVVSRELRPFPGVGDDEAAPAAAPSGPLSVAGAGPEGATPPAAYRVGLDPGWELWVGARRGGPGPGARFDAGLADLWARLGGRPGLERNVIALAIHPEAARGIHHLLRPGARLLVL